MKTFVTRSLSATVFAVIMLGGICWNWESFTLLFLVITLGALWEYYKLVQDMYSIKKISFKNYRNVGLLIGGVVYFLFHVFAHTNMPVGLFICLLPLLFIFFILEVYSLSNRASINVALNLLGIIYIAVPLGLLHYLITYPAEWNTDWFPGRVGIVFGILLMIWANDTVAYIGGSLLGKHKLFPTISPKKTWEGFFAGILGSVIVSFILSIYFKNLQLQNWIIISIIVSVTGTFGDLFESMLKRNAGVKDSGSIMPGHGGFLDRFDAFIFCIPFVYTYITVFQILK